MENKQTNKAAGKESKAGDKFFPRRQEREKERKRIKRGDFSLMPVCLFLLSWAKEEEEEEKKIDKELEYRFERRKGDRKKRKKRRGRKTTKKKR